MRSGRGGQEQSVSCRQMAFDQTERAASPPPPPPPPSERATVATADGQSETDGRNERTDEGRNETNDTLSLSLSLSLSLTQKRKEKESLTQNVRSFANPSIRSCGKLCVLVRLGCKQNYVRGRNDVIQTKTQPAVHHFQSQYGGERAGHRTKHGTKGVRQSAHKISNRATRRLRIGEKATDDFDLLDTISALHSVFTKAMEN